MYLRPAFAETDPARIMELIRSHHFGLLVTTGARGLTASPIPFVVEEAKTGSRCSAISRPATRNAPISTAARRSRSSAARTPMSHRAGIAPSPPCRPGTMRPSMSAGGCRSSTDEAEIATGLDALAAIDPDGFTLATLPPAFRAHMMAGIRAFRLVPTRVETQWKMSQNRSPADRQGVIAALRAQRDGTAEQVASLIEATLPNTV